MPTDCFSKEKLYKSSKKKKMLNTHSIPRIHRAWIPSFAFLPADCFSKEKLYKSSKKKKMLNTHSIPRIYRAWIPSFAFLPAVDLWC